MHLFNPEKIHLKMFMLCRLADIVATIEAENLPGRASVNVIVHRKPMW